MDEPSGGRVLPVVEREREEEQLLARVVGAAAGRGGTVLVEGPAGVGKSTLLDVAAEAAAERGMRVLRARGSSMEVDFQLGVVLQLLEATVHRAATDERERWFAGRAGLARPLLDATSGHGDAGDAWGQLHGLLWFAVNLAADRGVALVVDDAHWADRRSAEWLRFVSSRITDLPVLLLLAVRAGEQGPALGPLDELAAMPGTLVLRPRPLTDLGVALVTRSILPLATDELCHACGVASAGNPFLLRELLRTLEAGEDLLPDATAVVDQRPETLRRAVLLRLARQPADAVPLCRAVAALGSGCEERVAAELAGIDAVPAAVCVDLLEEAEVLRREADGRLSFVHPVIEAVVAADTPTAERQSLHRAAAGRLVAGGAPTGAVAAHLLRCPPTGDPWVVGVLREAAAAALGAGDPAGAGRLLLRALQEPPAPDDAADVLAELGRAETTAGDRGGVGRLRSAARSAPPGAPRAALLLEAGRTAYLLGDTPAAAADLQAAVAEAPAGSLRDEAAATLASTRLDSPLDHGAHLTGLRERDGRRTPGERAVLARAAMSAAMAGRPAAEAVALAEAARDGGRLLAEEGPSSLTLYVVSSVMVWCDATDLIAGDLEQAVELARSGGSLAAAAIAGYARAAVRRLAGRVEDACEDAEASLRTYQGVDAPGEAIPAVCAELALCRLERGDPEGAAAAVAEGERVRLSPTPSLAALWVARSRLDLAGGRPQAAVAAALRAGELLLDGGFTGPGWLPWRSLAALALARSGEAGRAEELAGEEVALARSFGADRPLGVALRTAALVSAPIRDPVGTLEEAAKVLRASPSRLELARTLTELGAALRRRGERRAAREVLAEALDVLRVGGAAGLRSRATEEMALAGGRPRRDAVTGVEALTGAERRVADLAAGGLTNREIAEELFVTPKTVEFHLRQVFMKLGVTSRRQLPHHLGS